MCQLLQIIFALVKKVNAIVFILFNPTTRTGGACCTHSSWVDDVVHIFQAGRGQLRQRTVARLHNNIGSAFIERESKRGMVYGYHFKFYTG